MSPSASRGEGAEGTACVRPSIRSTLRQRSPHSWPRPGDIISHTRTPAAPGADGTASLGLQISRRESFPVSVLQLDLTSLENIEVAARPFVFRAVFVGP